MKNPERILVVSMGTKQALKAVQWGISLARNYGAELFITHIVHNPFGLKGWSLPISSAKIIEDEFTKILEDAHKDLQDYIKTEDSEGLTIQESVIQGNPVKEITKLISEKNIDLMVMTAHEQGYIEHLMMGNDIRELIQKMPCSLFLVKRELDYKRYE
ncbi:universal stress protein [uncultured Desulfobacter sp.]|jgi:nucleotide-binding universal stress UspA family protein|uniref:universal stress protein n=1 Tax=uncultured Desulfobacter sp. TaxID=240139 RepID=UPI0029C8FB79|nr:universal stress protein [uncultured Desulfobacter sp.]